MKVKDQIKLLNEREEKVLNAIRTLKNDRFRSVDIVGSTGESKQYVSTILRSFQLAAFVVKEDKTYFRASERLLEYFSSL